MPGSAASERYRQLHGGPERGDHPALVDESAPEVVDLHLGPYGETTNRSATTWRRPPSEVCSEPSRSSCPGRGNASRSFPWKARHAISSAEEPSRVGTCLGPAGRGTRRRPHRLDPQWIGVLSGDGRPPQPRRAQRRPIRQAARLRLRADRVSRCVRTSARWRCTVSTWKIPSLR